MQGFLCCRCWQQLNITVIFGSLTASFLPVVTTVLNAPHTLLLLILKLAVAQGNFAGYDGRP